MSEAEVSYDITIIVRGAGGEYKAEMLEIPRATIMGADYPEWVRAIVDVYERFIVGAEQ